MAASAVYDLHQSRVFDEIVLAEYDAVKTQRVIALLDGDERFSFAKLDATSHEALVEAIRGADYVLDGLPDQFHFKFLDAVREVGVHAVSINDYEDDKVTYETDAVSKTGDSLELVCPCIHERWCDCALGFGRDVVRNGDGSARVRRVRAHRRVQRVLGAVASHFAGIAGAH